MNILVIGGAGYIGSHVVKAFLEKEYSITVYDNLSTGCKENIFPETTFVEADILDYDMLLSTMKKGFDCLIHLAAFKNAGDSMVKPEEYSVNNIVGSTNIINAASEAGVKHIVFSSSSSVYGNPVYLPIDEEHPIGPISYYGFTKLEIERMLKWYSQLRGLHYASLRYFNAAGYDVDRKIKGLERNPANLIPVIMEVALGKRESLKVFGNDYETRDGTGIRDYIHVNDLGDAHVRAFEYIQQNKKNLIINLGSEKGFSVFEILEKSRSITGKDIPAQIIERRPGDPGELFAKSSKAEKLLGWKAKYSDLETIIQTTWDTYRASVK